MFEGAEVGHAVDKETYERRVPNLRVKLVNVQYDLQSADFSVIVVVAGDDRLSAREIMRGMHDWMDGRYIESHALRPPSDEEAERPPFWRFWRRLPRKGRIGAFLDGWTSTPVRKVVLEGAGEDMLRRDIDHIRRFEQALADGGTVIVKLYFHLPKREYKKRLKQLEKKPKKGGWRVREEDLLVLKHYDAVVEVAETIVEETSTGQAPWHVIESTDRYYAGLRAANVILDAITSRLERPRPERRPPRPERVPEDALSVLATVDLSATLDKDYGKALQEAQADLSKLSRKAADKGISSILVFEGWDAAGKGGAIRRLCAAIDIRDYRIIPIAAPTEEEQAHHYLWRFWTHLPAAGNVVIFDRSWYGRVLVERVEGFATAEEWRRAYAEIRDFEEQLTEAGMVLCKFWLHIDAEEQIRRFKAREKTAFKKYKITEEDYRNREKWSAYERAVDEMVARTSLKEAPWTLVAANDKRHARVEVIRTFCKALKARLKQE
jgi:AMP-polyphosphate phosphotransferase